jgi:hypothetical protein
MKVRLFLTKDLLEQGTWEAFAHPECSEDEDTGSPSVWDPTAFPSR